VTDHLRILTVRQPWAWSIIHAGKTVENRSRSLGPYRGPVLIHASSQIDTDAVATPSRIHPEFRTAAAAYTEQNTDPLKGSPWMLTGHIIGVVDLVDVHDPTDPLFGLTGCHGDCTPWSEMGQFHLVLENPRALADPIPHTGGLGLRKTDWQIAGDWLIEVDPPRPGHSCGPYGCPPGEHEGPLSRLIPTTKENADV
jgi:hypothetical protein